MWYNHLVVCFDIWCPDDVQNNIMEMNTNVISLWVRNIRDKIGRSIHSSIVAVVKWKTSLPSMCALEANSHSSYCCFHLSPVIICRLLLTINTIFELLPFLLFPYEYIFMASCSIWWRCSRIFSQNHWYSILERSWRIEMRVERLFSDEMF